MKRLLFPTQNVESMTCGNRATVRRALCTPRVFSFYSSFTRRQPTRGKTASSERGEQLAFPRVLRRWKRGFLMRILANGVSSLSLSHSYRNLRSARKYDPAASLSLSVFRLHYGRSACDISRVLSHLGANGRFPVWLNDFSYNLSVIYSRVSISPRFFLPPSFLLPLLCNISSVFSRNAQSDIRSFIFNTYILRGFYRIDTCALRIAGRD